MKPITYLAEPETKIDHVRTGLLMRQAREKAGFSLRGVAMRLKMSHTMLADLEGGRRNWTPERCQQLTRLYQNAKKAAMAKPEGR